MRKARNSGSGNASNSVKKADMENFSGFKPAIEACQLTWNDYPIPGVTYSSKDGQRWHYRFSAKCQEGNDVKKPSRVQPVTICSEDIISTDNSRNIAHSQRSQELRSRTGRIEARNIVARRDSGHNDGAASSGSEGFCEPENRRSHDSDSSCEIGKDFHSRSNSLDDPELPVAEAPELQQQELAVGSPDRQDSEVFEDVQESRDFDTMLSTINLGEAVQQATSSPIQHSSVAKPSDLISKDSSQPPAPSVGGANPDPSSESQQSSDEYQMYFYDTKAKAADPDKRKKEKSDEPNLFSGLKKMENVQDVSIATATLFSCFVFFLLPPHPSTSIFLRLYK